MIHCRRLLLLILSLWTALAACAHNPGLSTAQGQIFGDTLVLSIGFAPSDIQLLLPPDARPAGRWSSAEFKSVEILLQSLAPQLWEVRVDGAPITPAEVSVELLPGDNVNFRLMFLKPLGAKKMVLRALKLGELPPTHREFVFIADITGAALVRKLLNAQDDTLEFPLVAAMTTKAAATETGPAAPRGFWAFLRLGVGRIWMGCDHLLFLLALLVVCRSFRSIAAILACFTLAHSLTLALATLNVVNLPGRIAGPAIAASLVFVGVENLLRRGAEPRGRWAVTFAFGLIHGFGFARVLRDVSVGAAGGQGVALPLFAFNLGVETGLIAVASIVLPIVWRLQKHPGFLRRGVPALSAVVSAAGLYWFLGRTVFS